MTYLSVKNLRVSYRPRTILHSLNLSVDRGQIAVITGPNGCGKSTLLRAIARLHRPDSGQIHLDGRDIWHMRTSQAARKVALLLQSPIAPPGMTVHGLVRHGRHPYQNLFSQWSATDEEAVERAMLSADILALRDCYLDELSGGQKQRCWLAMALAQDTPLLLLDEPISMLDLGHQIDILERVKQLASEGRTIVMVLHDLIAAARYADHLIAMRGGHIAAAGPPHQIVTKQLISELYDIEAAICQIDECHSPVVVPLFKNTVHDVRQARQL